MTPASGNIRGSLVVFADDWGRHPSSCQHLVRRLLPQWQTVWVNTIGMRQPRLDLATVRRGLEKLRDWSPKRTESPETQPENLTVLNPRMWPSFNSATARRLNRSLLVRQLRKPVGSLPAPVVAITTLPIVSDLVGRLPIDRWIYYCVDDFTEWPGLSHDALRRMERDLVQRVHMTVAVSETLRTKLKNWGIDSQLLTHGIDLEHWQNANIDPVSASGFCGAACGAEGPLKAESNDPMNLDGLERPLVVFWGLIDCRMDIDYLRKLGNDMQSGTILLVGPESSPDPRIASVPRLVRMPAVPYDKLPQLARAASVLIMPYADLPVTRAIQPLKLKEYLATGKPTVVRDLPAVREWSDCLDCADTAEAFSNAVRQRAAQGIDDSQRRARGRLLDESWASKAATLEQWIERREPILAS
jgi:glycosyltransferase involved in cell wall biosynthesis